MMEVYIIPEKLRTLLPKVCNTKAWPRHPFELWTDSPFHSSITITFFKPYYPVYKTVVFKEVLRATQFLKLASIEKFQERRDHA